MTQLVVGLDIGTASSKAVLARADGVIVATASRAHTLSLPRPGWAEMDAESVWWDEVASLLREVTQAAGDIAGLCISGVGPCLLLCDAEDRPLRPAILYGIDMRATAEIEELADRYGGDEVLASAGSALSTQAVGPKMLWVRRNEPAVWAAARRWHNSSSFAVARLTGEYVLDHHTASQCTPLYDIHARTWKTEWARDIAPGLAMPRLAWPAEVVGKVTTGAAAETGLRAGTPVSAGTIDAWAEAFSAGVRQPGDLMLMYGSTMFFVQVLEKFTTHPMLWTTAGVDPLSYTLAAGMATSGSITGWLQTLTGGVPYEQLVREAADVPAGSDGLLLLPYFAGERTPIFDPRARGVVAGLTLRHSRGHLFRAVYEGMGFGIRQILDFLEDTAGRPDRILAVGGGTQGRLWTQIVSDITGREQLVPEVTIGASYGDALLAAIGMGLVPPDTDWARVDYQVRPRAETRETYDTLFGAYLDLHPATVDFQHLLADLQQTSAAVTP
jgi:xylulokinase